MDFYQDKDCLGRPFRYIIKPSDKVSLDTLDVFKGYGPLSVNRNFTMPLVKQDIPGMYILSTLLGSNRIRIDFKSEAARDQLLDSFVQFFKDADDFIRQV